MHAKVFAPLGWALLSSVPSLVSIPPATPYLILVGSVLAKLGSPTKVFAPPDLPQLAEPTWEISQPQY